MPRRFRADVAKMMAHVELLASLSKEEKIKRLPTVRPEIFRVCEAIQRF
jgi:hypothetical protein